MRVRKGWEAPSWGRGEGLTSSAATTRLGDVLGTRRMVWVPGLERRQAAYLVNRLTSR